MQAAWQHQAEAERPACGQRGLQVPARHQLTSSAGSSPSFPASAAVTDASVGPRLQGSPRESIAVGEGPAEPAVSLLVWTGTGCFPGVKGEDVSVTHRLKQGGNCGLQARPQPRLVFYCPLRMFLLF